MPLNHDFFENFRPMKKDKLEQLHDDWVHNRPLSTTDFGIMLDEIQRQEAVIEKQDELKKQLAAAKELRHAADKGVKMVEVCGHTEDCKCCWCGLRKSLVDNIAAFDETLRWK